MEIPMEAGKGVYLVGEAAKAYVQYKYFDTVFTSCAVIIVVLILLIGLYKIFKVFEEED